MGLAEIAGHTVEGEQTEVEISGIKGHRDAVIDGRLIDVKSATTHSFQKFRDHKLRTDDPFGYLVQLGAYLDASQKDDCVKDKDKASFVAVDKQLGHIVIDTYEYPNDSRSSELPEVLGEQRGSDVADSLAVSYAELVKRKRTLLDSGDIPPRGFSDIPEGKSGNRKLCTECSYCPFKQTCWPSLRTFNYAGGPVFLTHVEREPNVDEKTKDGGSKRKF